MPGHRIRFDFDSDAQNLGYVLVEKTSELINGTYKDESKIE